MIGGVLILLNLLLLGGFLYLMRQPGLLGFAKGGRFYLSWFAVGLITLMDELTSIFYAPAEAHRFIGHRAIFFIAATSLLMRVLSSRMVEIAEILELNQVRGGGVYSFSYLVLGPVASFVAVASIMVTYILTACISTVSAVTQGTFFLPLPPGSDVVLVLAVIWAVAGLNILGIRENARVTFGIFVVAAVVLVNLIALGVINIDPASPGVIGGSARDVAEGIQSGGLAHAISMITIGVASCVLAYSGIESVIQLAGLVESWRDISKAYWFLALTVGIVTPLVSALLSPIDFAAHEATSSSRGPSWSPTTPSPPPSGSWAASSW
jgi:amino acid transporter